MNHLSTTDVFTYCSDTGSRMSWIDHVLYSAGVNDLVSSVEVLYSYVTSDHKPIVTTLVNLLICDNDTRLPKVDKIGVNNSYCPDWSKAGDSHYIMYVNAPDNALARVNIPTALFVVDVAVETSHLLIDSYYNAVLSCVTNCCN